MLPIIQAALITMDWNWRVFMHIISSPDAPAVFNAKSTDFSNATIYGINTKILPDHPMPSKRYVISLFSLGVAAPATPATAGISTTELSVNGTILLLCNNCNPLSIFIWCITIGLHSIYAHLRIYVIIPLEFDNSFIFFKIYFLSFRHNLNH